MKRRTPRELANADPDDARPGMERRQRILRITVGIALVALLLPGLLGTIAVQTATANESCRIVVVANAPDSVGFDARFELAGAAGPGWYCYAQRFGGEEVMVRALGIIPGLGTLD